MLHQLELRGFGPVDVGLTESGHDFTVSLDAMRKLTRGEPGDSAPYPSWQVGSIPRLWRAAEWNLTPLRGARPPNYDAILVPETAALPATPRPPEQA